MISVLCGVLGRFLVALVFALALVLAVPHVLGLQIFGVVSGSMEPTIPEGSVVLVQPAGLSDVSVGSVIAYDREGVIVTHRVVGVREDGRLVTQGDANEVADLQPVGAGNLVGEVVAQVPVLGRILLPLSSVAGKVALLALGLAGLILCAASARLRVKLPSGA